MSKSELEDQLALQLKVVGINYKRQYKWHPDRRFKADFLVMPDILVEVQGGIWTKGRHVRAMGYQMDCQKMCLAQLHGYSILYVTDKMIQSGEAVRTIEGILGQ